MKNITTITLVATFLFLTFSCKKEESTEIKKITFEEVVLGPDGYWNGSDGSGGFTSGNAYFRNYYNADYESWSGFAVSNHTDSTTLGYLNQYSSITASGDNSSKYAVLYSYRDDTIEFINPQTVTNLSISNSTYAYYSMRYGDSFAPKFGGESGHEPDYFTIEFKAVAPAGNIITFTEPLYLANYGYEDDTQDYIWRGWINVNLSSAGYIKSLILHLNSSVKNSNQEILTPMYICIDNIEGKIQK